MSQLLSPRNTEKRKPIVMDSLNWDLQDFSKAIEKIPNGSSSGPNGVPAVMMKKAEIPIGRVKSVISTHQ